MTVFSVAASSYVEKKVLDSIYGLGVALFRLFVKLTVITQYTRCMAIAQRITGIFLGMSE